jgi:streptogramin lyase
VCKNMWVDNIRPIGRLATAASVGGVVVSIVSPGEGTEAEMWGQRSSRLDPDRAGDQGRRRPKKVRGDSYRHRRHRPGVECLEDRQLLAAITEFPLPTEDGFSRGSLTVGPDGNLWFTENFEAIVISPGFVPPGGKIDRITPTGAITEFPLPDHGFAGALTVRPDGDLWFTVNVAAGTGAIGRITPAGSITEFPLPTVGFNPVDLTVGPDGNHWFTEYAAAETGAIGRITPAGSITTFPLPTVGFNPGDLTVGPDGDLWFTESSNSSSATGAIGRITPSGALTEVPLPDHGFAGGLTVGPDGNLWFTENSNSSSATGAIGRITPSGAITAFPLPAGDGLANALTVGLGGLTVGPDGDLWFTADGSPPFFPGTGPASIVRADISQLSGTGVVAVAHSRKGITALRLGLDEALDPATAGKRRFYSLDAAGMTGFSKAVKIGSVHYDRSRNTVRLRLAGPRQGPLLVTVRAGVLAAEAKSDAIAFTAVLD